MKPMKQLRRAILPSLLILTACQTPNTNASSVAVEAQRKAVEAAKINWCVGQVPAELRWPETGAEVSDPEYVAAPSWVKAYIVGNDAQWAKQCAPRAQ